MAPGARSLGAAFQKINFLRDLAGDHDVLGRSYFPGLMRRAWRTLRLNWADARPWERWAVRLGLPSGSDQQR